MIEELLMNVVNAMSSCLDEEQLDKLQNVLYINFHAGAVAGLMTVAPSRSSCAAARANFLL